VPGRFLKHNEAFLYTLFIVGGTWCRGVFDVRSINKRRQGWDYNPPPPDPARHSSPGDRDRKPRLARILGLIAVLIFLVTVIAAVYLVKVQGLDLTRLRVPMARKTADTTAPVRPDAPPEAIPVPAIRKSPDTTCGGRGQCSDAEFADLTGSLTRQWALVPDEIRSKCANNATYPSAEQCVLKESIPYLGKHPDAKAPWINPKNFDTAIMALCQKNPTSLALCSKP
jgi:hypothetical protein